MNDPVFNQVKTERVKQVHGSKVLEIIEPQDSWHEADGIVTSVPLLPIGVITADCVPVLFWSEGRIGAAHAGWKGALTGVLENTLTMIDRNDQDIKVMIGPSIAQKSYEVSEGFEKPFIDEDKEAQKFFIKGQRGKFLFDLPSYCAFRLRRSGVTDIMIDGRDTYTDSNFSSYRRGAGPSERNLSAIMITS